MSALFKSVTVDFHFLRCGACSIEFYIPDYKYRAGMEEKKSFFCPSGHELWFTNSKLKELEKQLEEEKRRTKWAEEGREMARREAKELKNSRAAIKGVLTRTKSRIKHGVCPCCNRSFQNVMRHMKSKHPDFSKEKDETK